MKNLLIRTTIICFSALLLNTGCKKFLEQEVPGAFPEQDFYKTDNDASQAVVGVYDMMQAHYNSNWASIFMVKSLLSDESNAGGSDAGDQPGYQTIDNYNFDATNDKIRDAWRMTYFTIYRANKVINKTDAVNDLRKRLVAEAKVLRAYNYFELVSLWGDVPLILDDVAPASYTSTGRSPKASVYAQIEKDLGEAIAVLPIKNNYSAADKFRVSKGTAQALLGKALLYQQKWNDAATQFESVITSNNYSLASSIGAAFSRNAEFGQESVFEISYTTARSYDWGNFPWGAAPESNIHIQLMGPRGDYYVKAPSDSLIGGWGFILPKQKLWNAFVAAGDVNRRRQSIMSATELIAAGGNWTNPTAYDYEGYFQRKYGSFQSQTGAPIGELNYGTNWRHIRYADVLLMAAEAYQKAGNDAKARGYLNLVRQRVGGLADVTASGAALFTAIVNERQLELAFEAVRFTDLVRWGLAVQELGSLGFKTGKHELLPIPDYDVKTGGLTQNPGFLITKKSMIMKYILNSNAAKILIPVIIISTFISCKKYEVRSLGAKPDAAFTVTPIAGQVNKYLLTSTSSNSFRFDWDKATGVFVQGKQIDTVYFPDKGIYTVKLLAYGQSGMDTASQVVNVANDDPAAQTPIKLLTGNSSKKWKLAPEAGALFIGPPDFSATWWQNNVGDVSSRSCLFNDEYTFNKTGNTMVYDSKGDFYVDEEGGNPHPAGMPAVGCYPNGSIPAQFQAWANNATFTFEVINNTKLKVTGTGAHLGLYKAANPPDAAVGSPQSSVTYDIISITGTRLVIKIDYGWGAWKFVYVAI